MARNVLEPVPRVLAGWQVPTHILPGCTQLFGGTAAQHLDVVAQADQRAGRATGALAWPGSGSRGPNKGVTKEGDRLALGQDP